MKKLKIGIMGTRGIPNRYGGFEQFAESLSQQLVKRGHKVWVYNPHHHVYKEKEFNGVQIIHCRDYEKTLGTAGQFLYDFNCLRDARRREYDVLLHLGYTSDSVWRWYWPKHMKHLVNMDGLEWKRKKYGRLTQWFLKKAEKWAAQKADALIADSPAIADHILKTYSRPAAYIPYGAEVFFNADADAGYLDEFGVTPHQYFLSIARMEPENNIEMIIRGYITSGHPYPLLIIGNITNKYGRYLTSEYRHPGLHLINAVYDSAALNNLRFYSSAYFHGHSVGGTNPSLLEAMACHCTIIAHKNVFNMYVLENNAGYFSTEGDISRCIQQFSSTTNDTHKELNIKKIKEIYNSTLITAAYEELIQFTAGNQLIP